MDLFDFHCDTLYECLKTNQELYSNNLAISLEKGKKLNKWCQTFAIYTPDNIDTSAFEHYQKTLSLFNTQCDKWSDSIAKCKNSDNFDNAHKENRCAALLSIENGKILEGSIDNAYRIIEDGVKIFGLTWNADNELASGVEGSGGGLTQFGKDVIKLMQDNDVYIDVSHLNEKGFWQIIDLTTKPIIATHSNLKSICDHKRNLTDEQFIAICKTGGVVGINFYKKFLGVNCFDKILENIYSMLSLGGENNIAIGSDYDGCDIEKSLDSIDKFNDLCNYLLQHGLSETLLYKICFKNAYNMFK